MRWIQKFTMSLSALAFAGFFLTCASATRMKPKNPAAFDFDKSCPRGRAELPDYLDDNSLIKVSQARGIVQVLSSCALDAIDYGDENKAIALYNGQAAIHNSPDTFGERAKIFGQGAAMGAGGMMLAALYIGVKKAGLFLLLGPVGLLF